MTARGHDDGASSPRFVYSSFKFKSPETLKAALVKRLREGNIDNELSHLLADMLSDDMNTEYSLRVGRRTRGNKTQGFDYDTFRKIEEVIDYSEAQLMQETKLNIKQIHDIAIKLNIDLNDRDDKTIKKYRDEFLNWRRLRDKIGD